MLPLSKPAHNTCRHVKDGSSGISISFSCCGIPFLLKFPSCSEELDPLCIWSLLKTPTLWPIKDCLPLPVTMILTSLCPGDGVQMTHQTLQSDSSQSGWRFLFLSPYPLHCVHPALCQSLIRPCFLRPLVRLRFWLESHVLSAVLRRHCPEGVPQAVSPH